MLMRHHRIRLLSVLILMLDLSLPGYALAEPGAQSEQPRQLTLTILHDNDLHGHLLPFDFIESARGSQEQPSRGGAARRATLVRKLERSICNPVILVDTGDIAARGPLATTYEGIADVAAMNAVGYDLAAIGNHEFTLKDGVDSADAAGAQADLLQVIKRSRFAWVCANVADSRGAFIEGVEPYVVRDFNGVRVGFLGLTTARSASYPQTKGWTFSDPIATAKLWIPEARKHCDVLIAVTHLGVDADKALAAQTSGLDAVVGGHSHTFLYKAVEVTNSAGDRVPIVQDGAFGVDLGRFDLSLTRDEAGHWKLAGYHYALLPVDEHLSEAPDVNSELTPFLRPLQTVVGRIGAIASTPAARLRQTNQLVVDALREQTGADLAINPGDGSDNGFFEVFRHSDVTRYDVYAILPFHDDAVTATFSGTELEALLASHPDTVSSGDLNGIDATKTYHVAVVDYVADSVFHLAKAKIQSTNRDVREVVIRYLQTRK